MNDLCKLFGKTNNDSDAENETQEIIQYVIQQYICTFVFNHEEFMPNENFICYLIDLMAYKPASDDDIKIDDDDENKIQFIPNSYTKQEIASKVLSLLKDNNKDDTKKIRTKLNDVLNDCELLSVVLLRAAESDEHSKWLQKPKKKQMPTEKEIKILISQLTKSSHDSFLNQIRIIAKCKVLIRYIVYHLNVRKFDESYVKLVSKLLNLKTKQSSQSRFQSFIRGLGFYFFSEFWNQKGSVDACKLRKQKKFTKVLLLDHIFSPKDIIMQESDMILFNSPYKYLDDNIFNLLKNNGHNLDSLTASKHTIKKLNHTINLTLKRLRSTVVLTNNNNQQTKPLNAAMNIGNNIIDEYKAFNTENSISTHQDIDFELVRSDTPYGLSNDRFSILSNEMYAAIQKSKEMSLDLELQKYEIVHLIGSLFNCAYLYGGKSDEKLYLWLRTQTVIKTPSRLHCLITKLLENSFPDLKLRLNLKKTKQMVLEEMLRVRLTWHLFGVCASIKQNPFWQLILDPLHYNNGYLIGMPESQQMQLLKAMKGHSIFQCPNRHLYFVADCGATKQTAKCNQCNAIIGNEPRKKKHFAAKGNKKIGKVGENGEIIPDKWGASHGTSSLPTQFLTEYSSCVGYIDIKGNTDCVRNLSEVAVCIIRIFILCMLWLHHSERSKQFPSNCLKFMFSKTKQNNLEYNNNNLSDLISAKIKKYINQIKKKLGKSIEDTIYVLHAIIHKLYLTYDNFYTDDFGDKKQKDLASRTKFEGYFMSSVVEPILQNLDSSINNVRSVASSDSFKKYWSKRIDMGFNTNNAEDLNSKKEFIHQYSPHLFLPFRHITISDFRGYVLCNAEPRKYPVTCGIIDAMDQIGLSIFATKYIPSIIIWMKLVHQRLSGRITNHQINEVDANTNIYKYNADWLLKRCKEENLGDFKKYEKSLIGFVDGWNHIAKRATTQKSEAGAKITNNNNKSEPIKHNQSVVSNPTDDDEYYNMDYDDDDDDSISISEEDEKNNNENDIDSIKKSNTLTELEEYARYVLIQHECSTIPLCIIEGYDEKTHKTRKPSLSDVPLSICINCIDSSYETSLMIRGILDHLVAANRTILKCCSIQNAIIYNPMMRETIYNNNNNNDDMDGLYEQTSDKIELTHINRNSDVVDIDQIELLRILQYCTQQSLEYGNNITNQSFNMNLPLLEAKLYERYIIGRKLIDYQKHQMAFVFAGHNNIKSYVDKINYKYSLKKTENKVEYFEQECSKDLKDRIILKLTIKTDRKKHKKKQDANDYQLTIISNAKRGIEQTLIGLARWNHLPQINYSLLIFMKENLRLFQDEYELFEDIANHNTNQNILLLKHCYGIWKLLDQLYTLKEGKWLQIPIQTPNCYRKIIKNQELKKKIKLFVNSIDKNIMWQFLMDWKDFIERILCNNDPIKHANKSTLLSYLKFSELNEKVLEKFPEQIKLENAGDAYLCAVKQYQQIL